ncbi:MAG TPA: hypothetical protein VF322_02910 [Gammaproteobacteria bacterium]
MRELTSPELDVVSGGGLSNYEAALITLGLMALSPTPLVIGVGAIALLYYAWC